MTMRFSTKTPPRPKSWIELELLDGRKIAILRKRISSVTEYPYNGANLAEIEILGRTWALRTAELYENVREMLTDLPREEKVVLPNQISLAEIE